jgi:hypothetical protein
MRPWIPVPSIGRTQQQDHSEVVAPAWVASRPALLGGPPAVRRANREIAHLDLRERRLVRIAGDFPGWPQGQGLGEDKLSGALSTPRSGA